ncbi:MAG: hypothetical protein ACRDZ8_11875 [Acidimicrobiales bacterium]
MDESRDHKPPPRPAKSTGTPVSASDLLSLQRSIGNRVVVDLLARQAPLPGGPVRVQRAILAIDGASDNPAAKAITANCLTSLQSVKSIDEDGGGKVPKKYKASDARGVTFGQGDVGPVFQSAAVGMKARQVGLDESIYVLGHGGGGKVADLTAPQMATRLNGAMGRMPGRKPYTGKVKLVACYSGSMNEDGAPIQLNNQPIARPYADTLGSQLASQRGRCRPSQVQGIMGIAWVDEETGKKVGFDVTGGELSPLETVYQDDQLRDEWLNALQEKDPGLRKQEMDRILKLVHKSAKEFKKLPLRQTGPTARMVYRPDYTPPPSKPWYHSLMGCLGF